MVVRINDRGPFVDNRIIDLSYTAAHKLDMTRAGTAFVEVEVLTPGAHCAKSRARIAPQPAPTLAAPRAVPAGRRLQRRRQRRRSWRRGCRAAGITNVVIHGPDPTAPLYRVRVGPDRRCRQPSTCSPPSSRRLGIATLLVTE